MNDDQFLTIAEAWDSLDSAMRRVMCALPCEMTRACERLEEERAKFSNLLHKLSLEAAKRNTGG